MNNNNSSFNFNANPLNGVSGRPTSQIDPLQLPTGRNGARNNVTNPFGNTNSMSGSPVRNPTTNNVPNFNMNGLNSALNSNNQMNQSNIQNHPNLSNINPNLLNNLNPTLLNSLLNNNNSNLLNNNNNNGGSGIGMGNGNSAGSVPIGNPLNAPMTTADVDTILKLQHKTEQFHQRLSHFINTHLPQLPDTMELMEKLQHDFDTNHLSTSGSHGDVSMNDNESSLPSLEHERASKTTNKRCNGCRGKQTEIDGLKLQNQQMKSQMDHLNRQLTDAKSTITTLTLQLQQLMGNGQSNLQNLQQNLQQNMQNIQNLGQRTSQVRQVVDRVKLSGFQFVQYQKRAGDDMLMDFRRTRGVQALKDKVRGGYDNSKWKCEGAEALYDYFDDILEFLNENEEDVTYPQILFPKNGDINMINGNGDDVEMALKPQTSVLEQFGSGLRAKVDIPKKTVLGQYIGVEYLEQEYHSAFSGSLEDAKTVQVFTMDVGDTKKTAVVPKIVLDSQGMSRTLLMSVRDAVEPSRANVLFVKVRVNGWPGVFVISGRVVKAGEEIIGVYGQDYYEAIKRQRMPNGNR